MRGLAIMVAVSALLGWLASSWLGAIGGVAISIVAFVAWGLVNRRSGEAGLFRANLKSYFIARRSGQSVDASLKSMIEARYTIPRLDLRDRQAIKRRLLESLEDGKDTPERARVVSTVLLVWQHEHDARALEPERGVQLLSQIDEMYDEIARYYGFSAN